MLLGGILADANYVAGSCIKSALMCDAGLPGWNVSMLASKPHVLDLAEEAVEAEWWSKQEKSVEYAPMFCRGLDDVFKRI